MSAKTKKPRHYCICGDVKSVHVSGECRGRVDCTCKNYVEDLVPRKRRLTNSPRSGQVLPTPDEFDKIDSEVKSTIIERKQPTVTFVATANDGKRKALVYDLCCGEIQDLWNNGVIELRDDGIVDGTVDVFGIALNYRKPGGDEDYLFISHCPFCGQKFRIVPHGSE